MFYCPIGLLLLSNQEGVSFRPAVIFRTTDRLQSTPAVHNSWQLNAGEIRIGMKIIQNPNKYVFNPQMGGSIKLSRNLDILFIIQW